MVRSWMARQYFSKPNFYCLSAVLKVESRPSPFRSLARNSRHTLNSGVELGTVPRKGISFSYIPGVGEELSMARAELQLACTSSPFQHLGGPIASQWQDPRVACRMRCLKLRGR